MSFKFSDRPFDILFLKGILLPVCSIQENKLSAVCERVLDRCLAPSTIGGEGCDNMTMILVQFKKPICPSEKAECQCSPASKPSVPEQNPEDSIAPVPEKIEEK